MSTWKGFEGAEGRRGHEGKNSGVAGVQELQNAEPWFAKSQRLGGEQVAEGLRRS
jgi:hypothetical protein